MNSPSEHRVRQDFIKSQKSDKQVRNIQIRNTTAPMCIETESDSEMPWKDQTTMLEGTTGLGNTSSIQENCTNTPNDSIDQNGNGKNVMETESRSHDHGKQTSFQKDETRHEDDNECSDEIDDEGSEDEDDYNMNEYYDDEDDIEYAYEIGKYAKPNDDEDVANMLIDLARTEATNAVRDATCSAARNEQKDETGTIQKCESLEIAEHCSSATQTEGSGIYEHCPDRIKHHQHQQAAGGLNLPAILDKITEEARHDPVESPLALNDPSFRATLLSDIIDAFVVNQGIMFDEQGN